MRLKETLKKQGTVTMISPENLNLQSLPSVALSNRKQLPSTSGIYFAIANGEVQYIGRSINIRQRWADHHRAGQLESDTHIAYLEVSDLSLLPEIEDSSRRTHTR